MNPKHKVILDRIKLLEEAIAKGHEYLESGKHADWRGFRPLFADKVREGKAQPPHKDWVKNVFLPRHEKLLRKAHELLERLAVVGKTKANQSSQRNAMTRPISVSRVAHRVADLKRLAKK
jgi:hypothetical protein